MAQTTCELGHEIVGMMDGEDEPRRQLAEVFNCPSFNSAGECLDTTKPDAVLVAGEHLEMPDHVQACVDRRLPFLLDKPFADCANRLRPVAEVCQAQGVFSALTLPNRASVIVATVQKMIENDSLGDLMLYSSRLNNGSPARYDATPSY